jgi:hypothetical protein
MSTQTKLKSLLNFKQILLGTTHNKNTCNLDLNIFDFVQNPSFFDHFKRRSDKTKHTFGNNIILTPNLGGSLISDSYRQGLCQFKSGKCFNILFLPLKWKLK